VLRAALLLAGLVAWPLPPAAAGEVRTGLEVRSPALEGPLRYSLDLPDAHGQSGRRFPVLYLLHGHGAGHREWLDGGRIEALLDELIAADEIAPLIAVMPDAGRSWYVDSAARGGPGDYASAILRDLADHVETRFATTGERAVAGHSMGGFGALRFGFAHAERFVTAAALSPAIFDADGLSGARWSLGATPDELAHWFAGAFGTPFDRELYGREQPFALVDEVAAGDAALRLWLASGDDDWFGFELGTVELFLALRARDVAVELRIDDGGHDWAYWRAAARPMLHFIDAGWRDAPGGPQERGG